MQITLCLLLGALHFLPKVNAIQTYNYSFTFYPQTGDSFSYDRTSKNPQFDLGTLIAGNQVQIELTLPNQKSGSTLSRLRNSLKLAFWSSTQGEWVSAYRDATNKLDFSTGTTVSNRYSILYQVAFPTGGPSSAPFSLAIDT